MRIEVTSQGGTLEIGVAGDLDLSSEQELVSYAHDAFTATTASRAVLDLTEVEFIDSSGLRALLRCRTTAENCGLPLRLRAGDGPVTDLLAIAGAAPLFELE